MRIGIDLGGSKIEIIALDDAGNEVYRKRIVSPRGSYPHTVDAITGLVAEAESQAGQAGTVGIGIPGTVSPATGLVKNANSTWLIGQPLQDDIEMRLQREVRIANDANCFVLSEAVDGAAQGAAVVFGVIIGTGTGGGLYVHGRLVDGVNGVAGEWGHNPLPWPQPEELPGRDCYCGKQGCIETWLSGPGLAADYAYRSGTLLQASDIAALAAQGDTLANAVLADYEDRMARALATVINIVDPDVVVLGGGLSKIKRLYQNVPRRWGRYVFSDTVRTLLLPPLHGDASGVRGAAWLSPATANI